MFDRHALTLLLLKLPLATFQVLHVEVDNTVSAYKGEGTVLFLTMAHFKEHGIHNNLVLRCPMYR